MLRRWYECNKNRVTNPLFIALISVTTSVIVSVFLVPYYTNMWQVNQKELDVKFDLAEDINDAVSSTIWSPERFAYLQFNVTDKTDNPAKSIPELFLVVQEKCLPIKQSLMIYFPQIPELEKRWQNICTSLSFNYSYGLLRYTKNHTLPFDAKNPNALSDVSRMFVEGINDRLSLGLTDAQLDNLVFEENETAFPHDIQLLSGGIINRTQELMQDIVDSELVGY